MVSNADEAAHERLLHFCQQQRPCHCRGVQCTCYHSLRGVTDAVSGLKCRKQRMFVRVFHESRVIFDTKLKFEIGLYELRSLEPIDAFFSSDA